MNEVSLSENLWRLCPPLHMGCIAVVTKLKSVFPLFGPYQQQGLRLAYVGWSVGLVQDFGRFMRIDFED